MTALTWRHIFAGALSAFFVLGGTMNIFATPDIRADYLGWGYPAWFPYVTGILQWSAALLIAVPRTRLAGSLLGAAIMGAAAATVLLHREWSHAIAPLVVLALVATNGWLSRRVQNTGAR